MAQMSDHVEEMPSRTRRANNLVAAPMDTLRDSFPMYGSTLAQRTLIGLREKARAVLLLALFLSLSCVGFYEACEDAEDGNLQNWRSLGDGIAAPFFSVLAIYQYVTRRACRELI